jgi:hypothetical protein
MQDAAKSGHRLDRVAVQEQLSVSLGIDIGVHDRPALISKD